MQQLISDFFLFFKNWRTHTLVVSYEQKDRHDGLQLMSCGRFKGRGCANEAYMILPTLGLDISIKHAHLHTFARQDKERQGEDTCQSYCTHSVPGRTRTHMHTHSNQSYKPWGHRMSLYPQHPVIGGGVGIERAWRWWWWGCRLGSTVATISFNIRKTMPCARISKQDCVALCASSVTDHTVNALP